MKQLAITLSRQETADKRLVMAVAIALAANVPAAWAVDENNVAVPNEATSSEVEATEMLPIQVRGVAEGGYKIKRSTAATKTDTPILETPMAVQVVSREVMDDQQTSKLGDVVKNVSSVQEVWSGGGQYESFNIRGFSTGSQQFRNGVRLPVWHAELANVDRVEVIKGPASVLTGRIEPGGMINMVTRKPSDIQGFEIQQQLGSYDYKRTTARAAGAISTIEGLSYGLDASYLSRNSFRDLVNEERSFIAPALAWKISDATKVDLNFEYGEDKLGYDNGLPAIGRSVVNVPINTNYSQPGLRDQSTSQLVELSATHKLSGDWAVRGNVTSTALDSKFRDVPVAPGQPNIGLPTPQVRRGLYFENFSKKATTVSIDLTGEIEAVAMRHKLLFGADSYAYKFTNTGFWSLNALPANNYFTFIDLYNPSYAAFDAQFFENLLATAPNDFGVNNQSATGLYVQDQMKVNDKFQFLLGGRYDRARVESGTSTASMAAIVTTSTDNSKFSPRLGFIYQIHPEVSFYGNYVESFGANNGNSAAGTPFSPQTAKQYELGMKAEALDGRVSSTIAIYQLTKQNILVSLGNNVFDTLGEARSRGVEFDVSGDVTRQVSMVASYTYTEASITNATDGTLGNRLPNVPLHAASFWAKYKFTEPLLQGVSFGAGIYAAGQRQGDVQNSYDLPGYAQVDLSLSYLTKIGKNPITAQLNLKNAFDRTYFYSPALGGSKFYNMPGDPRTLMGSLKLEL